MEGISHQSAPACRSVRLGNAQCRLDNVIGKPYGSVFMVADDGRTLQQILRQGCCCTSHILRSSVQLLRSWAAAQAYQCTAMRRSDAADWTAIEASERSNAKLVDDAGNQTLVQADIDRLKQSGASGEEVILAPTDACSLSCMLSCLSGCSLMPGPLQILAALEAASSTFASKTEFSQDKYRRKKARKYLAYATVTRPTARSICEVHIRCNVHVGHRNVPGLAGISVIVAL